MDSTGSPGPDHSWLSFSLSNNNYHHSTSDPPPPHHHNHHHQLCLFQQQPPPPGDVGGGDNGGASGQHRHDLSFLGGGGMLQVGLFPTPQVAADDVTVVGGGGVVGYESPELKSLAAAGLLGGGGGGGGFPNLHLRHHHQQEQEDKASAVVVTSAATAAASPSSSSSNKKAVEGFGHRTSIYRGVTRHRWTGRYEAHLWDNSCRREGQSRKGRQVYLGGYDKEERAARAYDLAALKYWGSTTTTNFPISDYEKELEEMKNMSRQEFVASLRRKSSGFSRGASIYRGVTRHHQHGRWQARIGRVAGNKDLYLGTFSTQEEAAEAYDIAAIKFRGLNAVTNFDISRYDVKSIITSNLPVGGMSNKSRLGSNQSTSDDIGAVERAKSDCHEFPSAAPCLPLIPTATINFAMPIEPDPSSQNYPWPSLENSVPIGYGFLGGDGGGGGEYVHQCCRPQFLA